MYLCINNKILIYQRKKCELNNLKNDMILYKYKYEQLDKNNNCKICYYNEINYIVFPCYHIFSCEKCINKINVQYVEI